MAAVLITYKEKMKYRLYTFVAGAYLSQLQRGLQSGHVGGELAAEAIMTGKTDIFLQWASIDKTIIITDAINHAGVKAAYQALGAFGDYFDLPVALFCEDEDSMNGMATACGIIVPETFYDVVLVIQPEGPGSSVYKHIPVNAVELEDVTIYKDGSAEFEFCKFLKSYRLVQS